METSPKTVLETYIREVTTLVHLTVNGEEIVTTVDHPFYVKNQGFIKAGELIVGDELLDVNGNVLLVENLDVELTDDSVKVYNFQVEDYHTYHVSGFGVLVHNASNDYNIEKLESYANSELSSEGSAIHPNVPEWHQGEPCRGVMEIGDAKIPLQSGSAGPGNYLKTLPGGKGSGLNAQIPQHVEGHAAAIMRQEGITSADLYINKPPCSTGAMCRFNLNKILPENSTLNVHFPNEFGVETIWQFKSGTARWKLIEF